MLIDWLKDGLKKPGKDQAGLAKALNIKPPQVSRMVAGTRRIQIEELPIIARYLEQPIPSFFDGIRGVTPETDTAHLRVVGTVPGVVDSRKNLKRRPGKATVTAILDPRFRELKPVVLHVNSTAMQRIAPAGSSIICLSYFDARRSLTADDVVVFDIYNEWNPEVPRRTDLRRLQCVKGIWRLNCETLDKGYESWSLASDHRHVADDPDTVINIKYLVVKVITNI